MDFKFIANLHKYLMDKLDDLRLGESKGFSIYGFRHDLFSKQFDHQKTKKNHHQISIQSTPPCKSDPALISEQNSAQFFFPLFSNFLDTLVKII